MNQPTRIYSTGDITVEWYPERCVHCEACKTNLPEVFNPDRRPWVDLSKADPSEIRKVVAMCPDNALSVREEHGTDTAQRIVPTTLGEN